MRVKVPVNAAAASKQCVPGPRLTPASVPVSTVQPVKPPPIGCNRRERRCKRHRRLDLHGHLVEVTAVLENTHRPGHAESVRQAGARGRTRTRPRPQASLMHGRPPATLATNAKRSVNDRNLRADVSRLYRLLRPSGHGLLGHPVNLAERSRHASASVHRRNKFSNRSG